MSLLDLTPLPAIFESFTEIQAVYLFGSYAKGTATARSDLDLGIVCTREAAPADVKLPLLTELARAGFDRVDVVMIDGSDLVLAHEVVKHNKVLFQRPDFSHGDFSSKVIRQFLDLQPVLELQRNALKARLSQGKG